jgi:hypothetical protein
MYLIIVETITIQFKVTIKVTDYVIQWLVINVLISVIDERTIDYPDRRIMTCYYTSWLPASRYNDIILFSKMK